MSRKPVPLADKRFDQVIQWIQASYPNSCVIFVDEILNPFHVNVAFADKQERLKASGVPYKILTLFHGTKDRYVDDIIEQGFQVSKNVTSAYGKGTYFGDKASTAWGYVGSQGDLVYMFICDVISTGFCLMQNSNRQVGAITVNDLKSPMIYCVPEDDSILMRYIVAFHKNPQ